ncbi:MAG: hypothetical protein JRS35_18870 [Deltaproteobacteria bacterium]|nr:hypothetical protein [Deltaproteobacteria bacterium]
MKESNLLKAAIELLEHLTPMPDRASYSVPKLVVDKLRIAVKFAREGEVRRCGVPDLEKHEGR